MYALFVIADTITSAANIIRQHSDDAINFVRMAES